MKEVMVCGRWPTIVQENPLRPLELWDEWERPRFESMAANLRPGTVLFDVGTEQGDVSVVYAQMVGGENMVLFEPHPLLWPNVKALWEANGLKDPLACTVGFLNSKTATAVHQDFSDSKRGVWPECAHTGVIHTPVSFRNIHDCSHVSPSITMDEWVRRTGIVPGAITIDVEGGELNVIEGAEEVLESGPIVWISVHPEMLGAWYRRTEGELHAAMRRHGYHGKFLGKDHEHHWVYWNPSKGAIA